MRLTEHVNIPNELLAAARESRLVLFVGAGVSMNAPSNLPLYDGLARSIAENLGESFNESISADVYLGQLSNTHPLIREQAKAIIASPSSQPNSNHRALARLAAALRAPIVSTNYDGHIEEAAAEESLHLGDRYVAPALPLGRSFSGVVYLHGSTSRPASELVVTDDDFGRAYLTDGWARRFVQDLFEHWTVLFVGYSHSDVVMTYLARGLPPSAQPRFVLTEEPDNARWENLHIAPVGYPPDNAHAALAVAVDAWASLMNMGLLDHHARARQLAEGSPPRIPDEADYLADVLNTPSGARGFASAASGYEWLLWVEEQPAFQALFQPGRCENDASRVLANWFVERFIRDPEHSTLALGTIARCGPVVSNELQWEISRAARVLRQTAPREALRWMTVLVAAIRTDPSESGLTWFLGYGNPLAGAEALPLLRRALVPRLVLTEDRPWFLNDGDENRARGVTAEIEWATSQEVLKKLWERVSEDASKTADRVLQIAEQALTDAYELLRAFNPDREFDRLSFRRSAIEPHEQDRFGDEEGTVIDMLRDSAALSSTDTLALSRRWMASPHALFRRLGLHLVIESDTLDIVERCAPVLGGLLYDPDTKHETFRLLAAVAPDLDAALRQHVLEAVLAGPPREDPVEGADPHRRRAIFDRLEWLGRYAKTWSELGLAISEITATEPKMGIRPHPDLDHYMTSGTWGGKMPLTIDEFISNVKEAGLHATVQGLLTLDYSERNFDDPTWDDTCRLLREVVTAHPVVGLDLLSELDLAPIARHDELIAAVLHGWSQSSLPSGPLEDIVSALERLSVRPELARAVSEVARTLATPAPEPLTHSLLERLDIVASEVWTRNGAAFDPGGWSDSLMRGLNTWPGILAQYWLNRISTRWQSAPDQWGGLVGPESAALQTMLSSPGPAPSAAVSILTGKLHFLFAADADFTVAHVFPLFDPELSGFAPDAWFSFLHEPRTPPDLLDAGFWSLLLRSSEAATAGGDTMAYRYWRTLASIAVFSTASAVDRPALLAALAQPERAEHLSAFIRGLGTVVDELDEAGRDDLWSSWLAEAITGRQSSAPGVQPMEERAAWGDLALKLGTAEALSLTAEAPGAMGERTRFPHLESSHAQSFADLLVGIAIQRLRLTPRPDWHVRHELEELVSSVRMLVDPRLLADLAELAVERGALEALTWVDRREAL